MVLHRLLWKTQSLCDPLPGNPEAVHVALINESLDGLQMHHPITRQARDSLDTG